MAESSLHSKTIRPGSLNGYAYYYSNRRPPARSAVASRPKKSLPRFVKGLALLAVIVALLVGLPLINGVDTSDNQAAVSQLSSKSVTAPAVQASNPCVHNILDKFIVISIEQRHLWACEGSRAVYQTAVITGLKHHPETETPLGTYKIYGKMTNTTLKGSDSRGAWSDPVYYWMPFLDNQYGTYGFHDATWRSDSAFGKVSPDSSDASHGCVELPLTASKWLYDWAPVGTTVTIQS